MKMLSSFTHPHVVPNLYEFLSYAEHKRWYSEEFWRTKQLLIPIDFRSVERNTMESTETINCLITSIPQNILFYVKHKKETHTSLERHEGE